MIAVNDPPKNYNPRTVIHIQCLRVFSWCNCQPYHGCMAETSAFAFHVWLCPEDFVPMSMMLCSVSKLRERSIWWKLDAFTCRIWFVWFFRSRNIFMRKVLETLCLPRRLSFIGNHIFASGDSRKFQSPVGSCLKKLVSDPELEARFTIFLNLMVKLILFVYCACYTFWKWNNFVTLTFPAFFFTAKNVAADISEKLCDSVATKLEGKVLGTFSGKITVQKTWFKLF